MNNKLMPGRHRMVVLGLLLLFAWSMLYRETGSVIALIGIIAVVICVGVNIKSMIQEKQGDQKWQTKQEQDRDLRR